MLLYDASDLEFAGRAVNALRTEGISCYYAEEGAVNHMTGESLSTLPSGSAADEVSDAEPDPAAFEETEEEKERRLAAETRTPVVRRWNSNISIFIDQDEDLGRANEILIKLGAVKDVMIPGVAVEAINRWVIAAAVFTVILIVLFILQTRRL